MYGSVQVSEPGFPDAVAPALPLASGLLGGTRSARDVVAEALGLLGVAAPGDEILADEQDACLRALNGLLRAWQAKGVPLWRLVDVVVDVAAGVPEVALAGLLDASGPRWQDLGPPVCQERPLALWSREAYDMMPNKAAVGTPTCAVLKHGRAALSVALWPIPFGPGRLLLTGQRRAMDVTALDQGVDVDGQWEDALVLGLADRLALQWPTAAGERAEIALRAKALLQDALDADRPQSVYMTPAWGERGLRW